MSFHIKAFEEKQIQYQYLASRIKEKQVIKENGVAVLFRTNAHMQTFAVLCNRLEIPYEMKEKSSSLYDHFIVKDVMAYLELAVCPTNREALLRVLNKPDRQLDREVLGFGTCIITTQKQTMQKLDKWQRDMEALKKMSLFLQVSYVRKGVGYEHYLKELARDNEEKWEEWLEILEFIAEESKAYDSLEKWKQAQSEYGKNRKSYDENKKTIHLMTVHASKGLEFDEVYIPDCNEKVYPHGRMPDKDTVEEERRIFYVGMTRAKKHLELLCVSGSKERPRVLSRFLNPLLNKHDLLS